MTQATKDRTVVEGFLSRNGVGDKRKEFTRDLFTVDGKHVSDIPEWAVGAFANAIRNADQDERSRCVSTAQARFLSLVEDVLAPLYDTKRTATTLIEQVEKKKKEGQP